MQTNIDIKTVEHIVSRAKEALQVVDKRKLRLASDCGMWFLSRERAFGKVANLEKAAQILRKEGKSL